MLLNLKQLAKRSSILFFLAVFLSPILFSACSSSQGINGARNAPGNYNNVPKTKKKKGCHSCPNFS